MMTDMTELSLRWNTDAPVWAEANAAGNRNAERAELQVMAKPSVPPENSPERLELFKSFYAKKFIAQQCFPLDENGLAPNFVKKLALFNVDDGFADPIRSGRFCPQFSRFDADKLFQCQIHATSLSESPRIV